MNDEKVTVISTINGKVGISLPELHFQREWARKGARIQINKDLLQEIMYDPGSNYMFETGILYIEDLDVKKELGLEPEEAVEPENIIVLSDQQMERQLKMVPISEFKETVKKLSSEQRMNMVDYAIEHDLVQVDKSEVLKEATGVDILSAVVLKKKNKED